MGACGGSSSAGAGRGAGGVVRQQANSAAAAPGRRNQCTGTTSRGSGGGYRVPPPRAPRSALRGQASGSGAPFDNGDEELEDDVEELASSGGPLVSQSNRAHWNDANSTYLLELCIQQRAAGTYNGTVMSGEGYQAVIDGLHARRGLVYSRLQVKNQIVVLKTLTLSGDTCKCIQGWGGNQMEPLMPTLSSG
uniref:Uncharacterized protein n=1 Tax=Triticum urartu TaxID=4572 RepID=A0A8R7UMK8_TRIUA